MDNKGLSIALLAVGIILIIFGIDAYHSASSGISRLTTGAPSTKALLLLIGGCVIAIGGFSGLVRK